MSVNLAMRCRGACVRRPRARTGRRPAFTLVELLVVITIITLLLTIMIPTVSSVRKQADAARSTAILTELMGGVQQYYTSNNNTYPGQGHPELLAGSSPAGAYTGSQVLAACMYGYVVGTPDPKDGFLSYNQDEDLLIAGEDPNPNWSDAAYSIADGFRTGAMAVLYYPARLAESGLGQFKVADNSSYAKGADLLQADFQTAIKDERFGSATTPFHAGKYLLVAAGADRAYFTDDDKKNWTR